MQKIRTYFFPLITLVIVFLFYAHTLDYPWKHFDEQIIYNETILPIPYSFQQLVEYLRHFGVNNFFEASNPFYSSVSNLRCDPINNLITLFVYLIFKKSCFLYHLLSLLLHILNTALLFLIINKISITFINNQNQFQSLRLLLTSILTLMWSLHPANIESILFACNWSAILTYSLCTILISYFVNLGPENNKINPIVKFTTIFTFSLIPLFNSEYSITLAPIIFFYLLTSNIYKTKNINRSLYSTFVETLPLFISLGLFIIFFLSSPTKLNLHLTNPLYLHETIQRIFWLSPQIFLHFIKLIFFPLNLSIDQTVMVSFSRTLFSPYSIFCSTLFLTTIITLLLSFILCKKKIFYLIFSTLFYFSITIFPFLHILSPSYCIASERYLYFPMFMLIFGISHFVFYLISRITHKQITILIIVLIFLLIPLSIKSYTRTLDWKDSVSLFTSALNTAPNNLFKAIRYEFLGSIFLDYYKDEESQQTGKNYINKSINLLEEYIKEQKAIDKQFEGSIPEVMKSYGLDPKTLQAKASYLLAFTKIGLLKDSDLAFKILDKYLSNLQITDTQILDLYLGLLFARKNYDKVETILKYTLAKKLSPTLLVIYSELYKAKYNNYKSAEESLKKSFKYFPYDLQTLSSLKRFYLETNKAREFAYYSYLLGIRRHSLESLYDAHDIYTKLNDREMIEKSLENIELIKNNST